MTPKAFVLLPIILRTTTNVQRNTSSNQWKVRVWVLHSEYKFKVQHIELNMKWFNQNEIFLHYKAISSLKLLPWQKQKIDSQYPRNFFLVDFQQLYGYNLNEAKRRARKCCAQDTKPERDDVRCSYCSELWHNYSDYFIVKIHSWNVCGFRELIWYD